MRWALVQSAGCLQLDGSVAAAGCMPFAPRTACHSTVPCALLLLTLLLLALPVCAQVLGPQHACGERTLPRSAAQRRQCELGMWHTVAPLPARMCMRAVPRGDGLPRGQQLLIRGCVLTHCLPPALPHAGALHHPAAAACLVNERVSDVEESQLPAVHPRQPSEEPDTRRHLQPAVLLGIGAAVLLLPPS